MKNIFWVAKATFQELKREKFVWVSLAIAMSLYLLSGLLGFLSFDEQLRIFVHFGMAAMQICMWLVAAFWGGSMISKEVERQTCLIILTRPLSRTHFFLGKMLGLIFLIFQLWLVLVAVIVLATFKNLPFSALLQSSFGIFLEAVVLALVAGAFASFMGSTLSVGCAFVVGMIGHWIPDLNFFAEKSKDATFISFAKLINYIIPQFHLFNFKSVAWIHSGGDLSLVFWMILHSVGWSLLLIFFAVFFFSRKDLV